MMQSSEPHDAGTGENRLEGVIEQAMLWWAILPLFELYIAVVLASVTHRDLFLLSTVRLPLLGAPVPPVALAVAAPALLLALLGGTFLRGRQLAMRLQVRPPGARLVFVIVPVLILLQAQLTFLPLHSPSVTWVQRSYVVLGLGLICLGWRSLRRTMSTSMAPSRWSACLAGAACVVVLLISGGLATFPGEWADEHIAGASLPFGRYPGNGWLSGVFSNRLDLSDQSFTAADPEVSPKGPSLRGRRLEQANFLSADVRGADFSGAFLGGANFGQADVREAKFIGAFMRGATFGNGAMEGADFSDAHLEGSDLNGLLTGVNFHRAHLRGAVFGFGASTHLEGANLTGAELEGALFEAISLQGADLRGAKLAGVTFTWNDAGESSLDGANLDGAELQGADFAHVRLTGASLKGAHVWRTINEPQLDLADITGIDRHAKLQVDIDAIRRASANNPYWTEGQASKRIARLVMLDAAKPEPVNATPADVWTVKPPATKALAEFLVELVCKAEPVDWSERPRLYRLYATDGKVLDGSFAATARGLMANGRLAALGRDIAIVSDRMKAGRNEPSACPGVEGFEERDWIALDALVAKVGAAK
jgi:uncharacterized protein YjbI with pentapeptide repeats